MGKIADQFVEDFNEAVRTQPRSGAAGGMLVAVAVEKALERAELGRHFHYTIPEGYALYQEGDNVVIKPVEPDAPVLGEYPSWRPAGA
jgi:hypothetical protein